MKPILFNTEMVKAILEGRKTVTRRVVKFGLGRNPKWTGYVIDGLTLYNGRNEPCSLPAPYQVNDILYVRETWALASESKNYVTGEENTIYQYKADPWKRMGNWKPSIHMPKEAARLFLRVTGVRVERLQDMTAEDCHKEGVNIATSSITDGETLKRNHDFSLEKFETLWDSTIKKDQLQYYGWNANPYVWVIEFERVDRP